MFYSTFSYSNFTALGCAAICCASMTMDDLCTFLFFIMFMTFVPGGVPQEPRIEVYAHCQGTHLPMKSGEVLQLHKNSAHRSIQVKLKLS